MYRGHRVIGWVPFGRERTVSILLPYLLKNHVDYGGLLDEIWFCMNTGPDQPEDRAYARMVEAQTPQVTLKPCPGPDHWEPDAGWPASWKDGYRHPIQQNTGRFPVYMTDPHTVYIRFDDDIVWVHPDAVRTLVDRVLDRRADTLAVFPLIWNNAVSSYMAQKWGPLPQQWGEVGQGARTSQDVSAVDQIGWGSATFAERLHELVLDHLEGGRVDDLLVPAELQLGRRQQFSVSCFAIGGWVYAGQHGERGNEAAGVLNWDEEEHWLTMHVPSIVDLDNRVCGMAQVAHFSFYTQRRHLLDNTVILQRYQDLASRVQASLYYEAGLGRQESVG